jgi:hypothetical protein
MPAAASLPAPFNEPATLDKYCRVGAWGRRVGRGGARGGGPGGSWWCCCWCNGCWMVRKMGGVLVGLGDI